MMAAILKNVNQNTNYADQQFENYSIAFPVPKTVSLDTKIVTVPILEAEICCPQEIMAAILKNVNQSTNFADQQIVNYSIAFLVPKNVSLDARIITVSILEARICGT